MATQLSLYNGALEFVGQTAIATLTDDTEARYLLDGVWSRGGIDTCLGAGLWNFATRTVRIDYDPAIVPDFGFARAFVKPDDWVRTAALSADEFFNEPLQQFADEAGCWFSDFDELYVKYVSNAASYGSDLSLWPESFTRYVESQFGVRIAPRLSGAVGRIAELKKDSEKLLMTAIGRDAAGEPAAIPPRGSWVRARLNGGARQDRARSSIP